MTIEGVLDTRFSEASEPVAWRSVCDTLAAAELYWLTTVRTDGRPHITPLVGVWVDEGFVFCTGPEEQKARNIADAPQVAVTTGVNTWNHGIDIVVEGRAQRLTGVDRLTEVADRYRQKYGDDWDFGARDDGFGHGGPDADLVYVFEVRPAKVLAFAKSPHGQTTFTLP